MKTYQVTLPKQQIENNKGKPVETDPESMTMTKDLLQQLGKGK